MKHNPSCRVFVGKGSCRLGPSCPFPHTDPTATSGPAAAAQSTGQPQAGQLTSSSNAQGTTASCTTSRRRHRGRSASRNRTGDRSSGQPCAVAMPRRAAIFEALVAIGAPHACAVSWLADPGFELGAQARSKLTKLTAPSPLVTACGKVDVDTICEVRAPQAGVQCSALVLKASPSVLSLGNGAFGAASPSGGVLRSCLCWSCRQESTSSLRRGKSPPC